MSDPTTYRRAPGAVHSDVNGLAVMVDLDAGNYYGLNAVGTYVWELLAAPHTVDQLVAALLAKYRVEAAEAEATVRTFLADMEARALVTPA